MIKCNLKILVECFCLQIPGKVCVDLFTHNTLTHGVVIK